MSTMALSPHHSAPSGMPASPRLLISTSDSERAKSDDTTQSEPEAVTSAMKRPLGERRMCEKGPRVIRWSIRSRASRAMIDPSADKRISTWPLVDWSGGMMLHA